MVTRSGVMARSSDSNETSAERVKTSPPTESAAEVSFASNDEPLAPDRRNATEVRDLRAFLRMSSLRGFTSRHENSRSARDVEEIGWPLFFLRQSTTETQVPSSDIQTQARIHLRRAFAVETLSLLRSGVPLLSDPNPRCFNHRYSLNQRCQKIANQG